MEKTYTIELTERQAVDAFGSDGRTMTRPLPPELMTDEVRQVVEDAEAYRTLEDIGKAVRDRFPGVDVVLLGKGRAAVLEVRPGGATEGEPR